MTVPTAIEATADPVASAAADHVFGPGVTFGRDVVELTRLVDPAFLREAGWDPASSVLFPPPAHRLLGRPVCTAPGCAVTAPHRSRICAGCRRRLTQRGLGPDQVGLLPARKCCDHGIGGCCQRQLKTDPLAATES